MQPAARIADMHTCPMSTARRAGIVTEMVPHVGGVIISGEPTVLIGGAPAATVGSIATCVGAGATQDTVVSGSSTVLIAGLPAARTGDRTAHGGALVDGAATVLIGD